MFLESPDQRHSVTLGHIIRLLPIYVFSDVLFWPGEAIKDVTKDVYGEKADDVAQRYAVALIWRF